MEGECNHNLWIQSESLLSPRSSVSYQTRHVSITHVPQAPPVELATASRESIDATAIMGMAGIPYNAETEATKRHGSWSLGNMPDESDKFTESFRSANSPELIIPRTNIVEYIRGVDRP